MLVSENVLKQYNKHFLQLDKVLKLSAQGHARLTGATFCAASALPVRTGSMMSKYASSTPYPLRHASWRPRGPLHIFLLMYSCKNKSLT